MSFKDYKNNRKNAFENLQKQLKNVNEGSSYKSEDDDKYWKMGKDAAGNGFAIIRFLPGIGDSGNDFVKTFSYGFQGPTGKWYIEESPNTIGKDDPVGVANSKLWNSGIESNKEIARKRKRRTKFVASIYVIKDRENPSNEGKVFWYAHPKTIYDMYNDLMYPEGAEDDELGRRAQGLGLVQRVLYLALLKRAVFGTKAHHHALARVQVAGGVQADCAGKHLQLGKFQHLPALAANAGLEQFIAPAVLAAGGAAAGNGQISL